MSARNYPPEITEFLAGDKFAVVGASSNRGKYGNKVLRCYLQHDLVVVSVNPKEEQVEGVACYPSLREVPAGTIRASVVAPPAAASAIVADAVAAGVEYLWFQPGAEEETAVQAARVAGIAVIAGGPCLLVALGFRDE